MGFNLDFESRAGDHDWTKPDLCSKFGVRDHWTGLSRFSKARVGASVELRKIDKLLDHCVVREFFEKRGNITTPHGRDKTRRGYVHGEDIHFSSLLVAAIDTSNWKKRNG